MTQQTPDQSEQIKALSQLLGAADDLRTQLNAITSFTSMAKKHIDDKERVMKCLNKLEMYAQPLKQIIGDLLMLAEEEYGDDGTPDEAPPERKRILLVEDNDMNREIARDILEENGFAVDEAEDGDVAVRMVAAQEPGYYACVLMDISMPRMDGLTATRAIRALGSGDYSALPIIAMTASEESEDIQNTHDAGMNAHLIKPVKVPMLMETLAGFF